jgi:hypothetical protein
MAEPIISVQLDLDQKNFDRQLGQTKAKITKTGQDSADGFKRSFSGDIFGGVAKRLAVLAGVVATGLIFRKSIDSAIAQQNAINDLNRSLAASGQFTAKASQDFQNFASALQNTSTFGDEVILKNAALIQSLGNLDSNGLKRATLAAANLSAALGIDLTSASTLVGKAAAGNVSAFSRYGLSIKTAATASETFSNALTVLEGKFGGAAEAQLNTFQGQITRTANAFDDILEGIGGAITKSPVLLGVLKTLGDEFTKLSVEAADIKFDELFNINSIIGFGTAINNFVIAPFELAFNIGKLFFNSINTFFAGAISQAGAGVGKIADLLNKIGVDNGFTQGLQAFRESSLEVLTENREALEASVDGLFDGTAFGKGEVFLENLRMNLEAAKASIEESGIKNAMQPEAVQGGSFIDSFMSGFGQSEITLANFTDKTKTFGQQIRTNLQAGIANGAGQAFAQFGAALASGNNALEAFAKAFISSIAQIAIQQGSAFILQGIAYQIVPGFQGTGTALIGAGAALAAFGGALGAFTGAGGGAGSPNVANGGSTISGEIITDPRTGIAASQERIEPSTGVNVTIMGDVFDSEETGLRISNILRESSLNNNVRATVFA